MSVLQGHCAGIVLGIAASLAAAPDALAVGDVVISQVYVGGQTADPVPPYANDFIELFNRSDNPVTMTSWGIQFSTTTSSSWSRQVISGTIPPGGYYLIQLNGGAAGAPLPTPDATWINGLSTAGGKIALTTSSLILSGTCPTSAAIVDLVGYNTASCAEPTSTFRILGVTNANAAVRKLEGCQDTDVNSEDFILDVPNPRNSSTPLHPCSGPPPASCVLGPDGAFSPAGGMTSVTIVLLAGGEPVPDTDVAFTITAGPNAGQTGAASTDVAGEATFAYTSNGIPGQDTIEAAGTAGESDFLCTATHTWYTSTPIVINEIDIEQGVPSSRQFVELHSAAPGTPLDGLAVVFFNGNLPGDVSYLAFDLDGHVTSATGHFVIGNGGVVPPPAITVLDGELIHILPGAVALYAGDAADFPDGTAPTLANLLDAVVYDTDDPDDAALLAALTAGQPQINESGGGDVAAHSSQRCTDSAGGPGATGSFMQSAPTPWAANAYENVATDLTADPAEPCVGETVVLSADAGPEETVRWTAGSLAAPFIPGGAVVTVNPTETTTYFARIENLISGCLSEASETVEVVVTAPEPPGDVAADPATICPGPGAGPVTLSCTIAPGETAQWFAGSCESAVIGTGTSIMVSLSRTTTFYVRAVDAAGNCGSVCELVLVAVEDVQPPMLIRPLADQALAAGGDCQAALPDYTALVMASDDCTAPGDLAITQTPPTGTMRGLGETVVSFVVSDDALNQLFASMTVTVEDVTPPVFTISPAAPSPLPMPYPACSVPAPDLAALAAAEDTCGKVTIAQSPPAGAPLPPGTTTIIITATDEAGNTVDAPIDVEVVDLEPPIVTCPADSTIRCGESSDPSSTGQAVAVDCDPAPAISFSDVVSGVCPATITRTWTATDAAGNSATCDQIITIDPPPTDAALVLVTNIGAGCAQVGQTVTVTLSMADLGAFEAAGFEATIEFDPATLQFVSGAYSSAPFGEPLVDPIVAAAGLVHIAAQIDDGAGQTPGTADADLVELQFITIIDDEAIQVRFALTEPTPGALTDAMGERLFGLSLVDANPFVIDGTPPVVDACPPDNTVQPNAGQCSASVAWTEPIFTDDHEGLAVSSSHASGASFDVGETTVTIIATDCAGNETICSFVVTIEPTNGATITVAWGGASPGGGPIGRCVRLEFWECAEAESPSAIIDADASFIAGQAVVNVAGLPCGSYTCVTARDPLHTLRRTAPLAISGSEYIASFTGPASLIGGNLNGDAFIDILDFGGFVGQFGTTYPSSDTSCATGGPHADFSGDGSVGLADFTFIQVNFLRGNDPNCCTPAPGLASAPVSKVGVADLLAAGQGGLAAGDLNQDGWLDAGDVAAFAAGTRPQVTHAPGGGTKGGSWFDAASWSAGVPGAETDVTISGSITIAGGLASARHVTITSGGVLQLTGGSLIAQSITLSDGATLVMNGELSAIQAGLVFVNVDALLIVAGGSIDGDVINAGTVHLAPGDVGGEAGGLLQIAGGYTQLAPGRMILDVVAMEQPAGLDVAGTAQLAGGLTIHWLMDGDVQSIGAIDVIHAELIAGGFDSFAVIAPAPGSGGGPVPMMHLVYGPDTVIAALGADGPEADLDGDGRVDGIDLGILLSAWSMPPGAPGCGGVAGGCAADLNGDGVVDGLDLGILLSAWTG